MAFKSTRLGRVSSRAPSIISDASHNKHYLLEPPSPPTAPTAMGKRKAVTSSSDEEDDAPLHMPASSPDRPLQTGRRSGKKAKSKAESDDESEAEQEQEKPVKKSKAKEKAKEKARAAKAPSIKKPRIPASDEEEGEDDIKMGVTTEGDRFVELGKKKRATVRMFKGSKFLDIREFYGDEDDLKPGKKGISINHEQWEALKKSSDVIDSFFARLKG